MGGLTGSPRPGPSAAMAAALAGTTPGSFSRRSTSPWRCTSERTAGATASTSTSTARARPAPSARAHPYDGRGLAGTMTLPCLKQMLSLLDEGRSPVDYVRESALEAEVVTD